MSTTQPATRHEFGSGEGACQGGRSGGDAKGGNPRPTFQSSQLKWSIGMRQSVWPVGYMEPRVSSSEFETPRAANVFASSGCPSPFVSSTADPLVTLRIFTTRPLLSGSQRPLTLSYEPLGMVIPTGNERKFSRYP